MTDLSLQNLPLVSSGNNILDFRLSSERTNQLIGNVIYQVQQTPAEHAAGVTPVNTQFPPGNVLRYGKNTTPGTTDMTAAFQAAWNQHVQSTGAAIYAPAGVYLITATVGATTNFGFSFHGDGMGRTFIEYSGTTDCFEIFCGGSSQNQVTVNDMTLSPIATSAGSGFSFSSGGAIPSVTMRDVLIINGGGSFVSDISTSNCGETLWERVFIYGTSSASGVGMQISSSGSPGSSATVHKFSNCSIYNVTTGVVLSNGSSPGLEGIQFVDCDIVGVQNGVSGPNSIGLTYFPAQFTWQGGHINASLRNIVFNIRTQITIADALFYNSGSAEMILLSDCADYDIHDNKFINIGSGSVSGVGIVSSAGPVNGGSVHDNSFNLTGGSGFGVYISGAGNINNLSIHDNQRVGGTSMVNVTSGTLTASTVIRNNFPLDPLDAFDTTLTFAATLSLIGIRASFVILTAPAGATTMTAMTSRYLGDKVTLSCSSALATIQHNGGVNGFILAGGVNYTFPATGGRITLVFANGGFWTEISRD